MQDQTKNKNKSSIFFLTFFLLIILCAMLVSASILPSNEPTRIEGTSTDDLSSYTDVVLQAYQGSTLLQSQAFIGSSKYSFTFGGTNASTITLKICDSTLTTITHLSYETQIYNIDFSKLANGATASCEAICDSGNICLTAGNDNYQQCGDCASESNSSSGSGSSSVSGGGGGVVVAGPVVTEEVIEEVLEEVVEDSTETVVEELDESTQEESESKPVEEIIPAGVASDSELGTGEQGILTKILGFFGLSDEQKKSKDTTSDDVLSLEEVPLGFSNLFLVFLVFLIVIGMITLARLKRKIKSNKRVRSKNKRVRDARNKYKRRR